MLLCGNPRWASGPSASDDSIAYQLVHHSDGVAHKTMKDIKELFGDRWRLRNRPDTATSVFHNAARVYTGAALHVLGAGQVSSHNPRCQPFTLADTLLT